MPSCSKRKTAKCCSLKKKTSSVSNGVNCFGSLSCHGLVMESEARPLSLKLTSVPVLIYQMETVQLNQPLIRIRQGTEKDRLSGQCSHLRAVCAGNAWRPRAWCSEVNRSFCGNEWISLDKTVKSCKSNNCHYRSRYVLWTCGFVKRLLSFFK